ncbi:MAG: fibronectin type III domain-containing protein, partial [Opitutaceae bacterium]
MSEQYPHLIMHLFCSNLLRNLSRAPLLMLAANQRFLLKKWIPSGRRLGRGFILLPICLPLVCSTLRTLAAQPEPAPVESSAPSSVATFSCLSLYWSPPSGASENTCSASYREKGSSDWHEALPLWYDTRNQEYRGSIVSLKPGTAYEVKLRLDQSATETVLKAATWTETAPIAKVIRLPADTRSAPLVISEGGSPD